METNSSFDVTGLHYSIALAIVSSLIMLGSWLSGFHDPLWVLLSGVICTEIVHDQTKSVVVRRIMATLIGTGISCVLLMVFGSGFVTLIAGIVIITLVMHYLIPVHNSWKLAVATGAIVLLTGFEQNSIAIAENIALKRALEVTAGSLLAGLVSMVMNSILRAFKN